MAHAIDRDERQVRWFATRLRAAMERDRPEDEMELVRAMFGIHRSSGVIAAFRAWVAARARYRAADPRAPDHEWLRREMDRLCSAYEAAVAEAHGP